MYAAGSSIPLFLQEVCYHPLSFIFYFDVVYKSKVVISYLYYAIDTMLLNQALYFKNMYFDVIHVYITSVRPS